MSANPNGKEKRRRLVPTLDMKLKIIAESEAGARAVDIGREYGMPATTVRTILKNKQKYKSVAELAVPDTVKCLRSRENILLKTEKLLLIWITEHQAKGHTLSSISIRQKAKRIFDELKADEENCQIYFIASKGWFDKFKARTGIQLTGGVHDEVAGADIQDAESYIKEFEQIIEEFGYVPQQVFNVDETVLLWKKMPSKTFPVEETNDLPSNDDRMTLLLGGNASGDFKLRPTLIYHCETPTALENIKKSRLPVVWKSNWKARITKELFQEWFLQCFCPSVRIYLSKSNLPENVLLIIDNAPCHPSNLDDLSEGMVRTIFLPANAASILQPMGQNVIANFKRYYHMTTLAKCLEAIKGENSSTLREFWNGFSIKDAIDNVAIAWEKISSYCVNAAWRNLWPECVKNFSGCQEETPERIEEKIVDLGNQLGFLEFDFSDVEELLEAHDEELSTQELVQMYEYEASYESFYEIEEKKPLRTSTLIDLFKHWEVMKELIQEDPNAGRSYKVIKDIEACLHCYKKILNKSKKARMEATLDFFRKRKEDDPPKLHPSTSGLRIL